MKEQMMRQANQSAIKSALQQVGFMHHNGVYVLVDGQYGSTGKGVVAGLMAELYHDQVTAVTTNAGPNSGHTSYFDEEKIVLRQLPTFGVVAQRIADKERRVNQLQVVLNAGAVIDIPVLNAEVEEYRVSPWVSPWAAVVTPEAKEAETGLVGRVGSTGKGTGAALAAKVLRQTGSVVHDHQEALHERIWVGEDLLGWDDLENQTHGGGGKIFVEVSQGFSLGINEGMFPYTTSRQCTVAQALADARLHPTQLRGTVMVVRTFPIRVAGNSGPHYEDQREITWEELGQTPELTTVTQKVRRVFTWSRTQFCDAVAANRPSVMFLNFANYFEKDPAQLAMLADDIREDYRRVMGKSLRCLLVGFGPTSDDVAVWG